MNQTFREVVQQFIAPQKPLTHQQNVTRLYKKALKTLDSWVIDRRLWNELATEMRAEFDANRNLSPYSSETKVLLIRAHEKLEKYTHPDRYTINYMPGGTKFMRNSPLPLEVCYPNGVPDDVEVSPVSAINIDGTHLPAKENVFVDFSNKQYY